MASQSRKPLITTILVLVILGVASFAFLGSGKKAPETPPIIAEPVNLGPIRKTIGYSVENRPIDAFSFGSGPTHLVFVGGIHGGYEWNSVLLAYRFMDYLSDTPDTIPKDLTVTVIPSANPDGVYKVVGKGGRFSESDASTDKETLASGRFNAHKVDLNRNFDCKWQPKSTWQNKTVSAGGKAFSEPEAEAIRSFVAETHPDAVVFWHSQANAVYASQCENGILPETLEIMDAYSEASEYKSVKTFDAYEVTGASEDWLASQNIPALTVELQTRETVEFDRNLAGIKALFDYYAQKTGN